MHELTRVPFTHVEDPCSVTEILVVNDVPEGTVTHTLSVRVDDVNFSPVAQPVPL